MSLKQSIQAATTAVFKAAESVLTSIIYVQAGIPEYNTDSGAVAVPETLYVVKGAFSSFKDEEVIVGLSAGSNQFPQIIQPGDKKCVINKAEFSVLISPSLLDFILEGSPGTKWDIVAVKEEPTESLIILQLRRV